MFSDVDSRSHRDGSINLNGRLFCTRTGRQIGHFKRRFLKTKSKSWHAEHKAFFITDPAFQDKGICRSFFARAISLYVPAGVEKISLDAVLDGRLLWLHYGFKPEAAIAPRIHSEFRRVYKKQSGREFPRDLRLPTHGPSIVDFRYRGIRVGRLALGQIEEMPLTMDLRSISLKLGFVMKGWLPIWDLVA